MKWLIIILILVVLIVGCTQISSITCKPDWVLGFEGVTDDVCKAQCYATAKSTHYKIEEKTNQICNCIWVYNSGVNQTADIENTTPENCNQVCQQKYAHPEYGNPPVASKITNQVVKTCYCDVNKCNS